MSSNELEIDYTELASKINDQLEIAKKAIDTATKLAKEANVEGFVMHPYAAEYLSRAERDKLSSLTDLLEIRSFEQSLTEAGWQMSSIGC